MARDKLDDATIIVGEVVAYDTETETRARQALAQVLDRAQEVAAQVGYDGPLTPDALDDGIHLYQRRAVEDCLELGKRLVVRRELTPHGEWLQTVERLGFAERTARRFMAAAVKTGKSAKLADLATKSRTAGHYLELLTLDDDEVEVLSDGGSVAGVTLDDIDRMSVSALRRTLRDARAEKDATDKVLAARSKRIDDLQTRIETDKHKAKNPPLLDADGHMTALESAVTHHRSLIEVNLRGPLKIAMRDLIEHASDAGQNVEEVIAGQLLQITRALGEIREELGVKFAPDGNSDLAWINEPWAQPGAQDEPGQ